MRLIASAIAAMAISAFAVVPAQAYTEDGLALYIDARNTDSYNSTDALVVNDVSPSDYVGSLVGAVTFDDANGEWDFAGGGTGESNIDMGALDFDFSGGMTFEFLANFGELNPWERIVDFGDGPHSNNIVITRHDASNQLMLEIWNSGSAIARLVTADDEIIDNETAHWVVTLEVDGTAHVYKNGEEVATEMGGSTYLDGAPYGGLPDTVTRNYGYIGRSLWGDPEFAGSITYLRVYERALTSDEVSANLACDGATDAACAAAQSSGSGNGLASTGFDGTIPALAGLAVLALGVSVRRRVRT